MASSPAQGGAIWAVLMNLCDHAKVDLLWGVLPASGTGCYHEAPHCPSLDLKQDAVQRSPVLTASIDHQPIIGRTRLKARVVPVTYMRVASSLYDLVSLPGEVAPV